MATGVFSFAGIAASVTPLHKVIAARGNFLLGTPDAALGRGRILRNTTVATFNMTGGAVTARVGRRIAVNSTSFAVVLTASGGRTRIAQLGAGSIPFVGLPVTYKSKYRPISADAGALHLGGFQATFFVTRRMVLDPCVFSLYTSPASLAYSGSILLQPGRRWRIDTYMAVAGAGGFLVDSPPRNGIECDAGIFTVDSDQALAGRAAILGTGVGVFVVGHVE